MPVNNEISSHVCLQLIKTGTEIRGPGTPESDYIHMAISDRYRPIDYMILLVFGLLGGLGICHYPGIIDLTTRTPSSPL
jgi:hypothetical protein